LDIQYYPDSQSTVFSCKLRRYIKKEAFKASLMKRLIT
jgi:hypothetical protein